MCSKLYFLVAWSDRLLLLSGQDPLPRARSKICFGYKGKRYSLVGHGELRRSAYFREILTWNIAVRLCLMLVVMWSVLEEGLPSNCEWQRITSSHTPFTQVEEILTFHSVQSQWAAKLSQSDNLAPFRQQREEFVEDYNSPDSADSCTRISQALDMSIFGSLRCHVGSHAGCCWEIETAEMDLLSAEHKSRFAGLVLLLLGTT